METMPEIPRRKEWAVAADVRKIISDDAGNLSSKRVLAMSWGFGVLAIWINASLKTGTVAPLSWEVCGLVLSLAGVVAVGKWGECRLPGGPEGGEHR